MQRVLDYLVVIGIVSVFLTLCMTAVLTAVGVAGFTIPLLLSLGLMIVLVASGVIA